jgi:hypothetical protein
MHVDVQKYLGRDKRKAVNECDILPERNPNECAMNELISFFSVIRSHVALWDMEE